MPELQQERQFQKRDVAYKARISDILGSSLIKDGLSAGYIELNGVKASRVNIIATLVYKIEQSQGYAGAVIDDGTGRLSLRSFENLDVFSKADVGDAVLVICRIREFNNEKYASLEILKKIRDAGWLNLRKLELEKKKDASGDITAQNKPSNEDAIGASEEIYLLVKRLDDGNGAQVDEVIKNSSRDDAESIVNSLLVSGDIFEISPGRVKVLE